MIAIVFLAVLLLLRSAMMPEVSLRETLLSFPVPSSTGNHGSGSPHTVISSTTSSCEPNILYRGPIGLPALRRKRDLGRLLEQRRFVDGAEVGVKTGQHAAVLLTHWKSCQSMKLIDLWAQQPDHANYHDLANVDNATQQSNLERTQTRLQSWAHKIEYFRMYSVQAAARIANHSLDFIFIDARHDYCGVKEDLDAFYPKLRPGGILAGHDYLDAAEMRKQSPRQDWSICADGSIHTGAVKGAVEDFALQWGLVISVVYADRWPSWMIQKPTIPECILRGVEEDDGDDRDTFGSQVNPLERYR